MYKRLSFILVLISVLAMVIGVAATPATDTRNVRLVSVGYYGEKGVVFKFQLTGDFQGKEIKGSVLVGGKSVRVYCVRKEAGMTVNAQCVAAAITSRMAGKQGVIKFAGSSFAFIVPARNTPR